MCTSYTTEEDDVDLRAGSGVQGHADSYASLLDHSPYSLGLEIKTLDLSGAAAMCNKHSRTENKRCLPSNGHLVVLLLLSFQGGLTALTNDDVSGPVVKLTDNAGDKNSTLNNGEEKIKPSETFAQLLDQALQKEFVDETTKSEGKKRTGYNATAKQDDVSCLMSAFDPCVFRPLACYLEDENDTCVWGLYHLMSLLRASHVRNL